ERWWWRGGPVVGTDFERKKCYRTKRRTRLTPRGVEKLGLHNAGYLALQRLARGLRLNYTEAVHSFLYSILEFVRDGDKNVAELMNIGQRLLGRYYASLLIADIKFSFSIHKIGVEGTMLITIHDAIASENGNLELGLHCSFLPGKAVFLVGSHYHFIEVDPSFVFYRRKAYGRRLNIPAGTAKRFEVEHFNLPLPGECKTVVLVSIGGRKVIRGGNGIVDGPVDDANVKIVMETIKREGYGSLKDANARFTTLARISALCFSSGSCHRKDFLLSVTGEGSAFSTIISCEGHANMYGPTTGDKIQLGDTNLYTEIERDFAVYSDECVFWGGKVIRDGMGQSCRHPPTESSDIVITNAVIIDYTHIFKADIGIKNGLIVALGKAGNPDAIDGVFPSMIIGVNTEVLAGKD
ncbi:hypothetical protein QUC31_004758, partial [Theobroma cacao]